MEPRIFHGSLTPSDLSRALLGKFNRGNLRAQQLGEGDRIIVQITTRRGAQSGGQAALSISLERHEDGVSVQMGELNWYGVAASLGQTALSAWRNPLNLIHRLDDLAQDVENLQLVEEAWKVIEVAARQAGASFALSERLRRLVCEYCRTANPTGEPSCIACGAPLGDAQPRTCSYCGFVLSATEVTCPNCHRGVR